jgi:Chalcone isomerase-like
LHKFYLVVRSLIFGLGSLALIFFGSQLGAQDGAQQAARQRQNGFDSTAVQRVNLPQGSSASFFESVLPGSRMVGTGELRFFGFKIYDAHLWTPKAGGLEWQKDPSKILGQAFALDLRYARSLKGEEIAERSLGEIRRLGLGSAEEQERWLTEMKKIFPNVVRGDRITGVFQPGEATRFYFNEKALGRIDDVQFGPAFFNIWFDPRTRAPGLRESLTKAMP